MELSTGNRYQAEALPNVLRYHICRSSHPEDRKLPITQLKWDARTPVIGVKNVKAMSGGRLK
jgi:hypothetical protein